MSARVLEYWYKGQLVSAAAPVYLQVAEDRWVRFLFDSEEFFWRAVSEPDDAYDDETYRNVIREVTPSLTGRTVSAVHLENPSHDVAVLTVSLTPSGRLVLRSEDDTKTLRACSSEVVERRTPRQPPRHQPAHGDVDVSLLRLGEPLV
jgi:hypothetical protein